MAAVVVGTVAGPAAVARADVTTMGGDPLRTSWYSEEPTLSSASVGSSNFGQLFATRVDGQVYAQPLVVSDTVVAATENNKVYGLDEKTGKQVWMKDLGPAWPASNVSCGDLTPTIGVTSTPVYDPATDAVYLTAKTNDTGDANHPHWYVHALDPDTGAERPGWPVTIQGNPTNDPTRPFNPRTAAQRPGLLLLNGVVYAGFASHCDTGPFVGYVVGVSTTAKKQTTMWATESGNAYAEGGIWQSGGGLVSDGSGRIFFATGNGISPTAGPGKQPPSTLAESVVALTVQPDGSLRPSDFFSPSDNARLDQDDWDLGSGAPLAIPDGYGTSAHPHLLVQVGKDGRVYLLDRDDLGGMGQGTGGGDDVLATAGPYPGVWGKPAFFGSSTGGYVYTVENQGALRAYKLTKGSNGSVSLAPAGASAGRFGYTSGSPVVTSTGADGSSALVWVVYAAKANGSNAELRAYSAIPDSTGILQQRFSAPLDTAAKFSSVAVDSGRVYVGTRAGLVYGFGSPTTAAFKVAPAQFPDVPVGGAARTTLTVTATRDVTLKSAPTTTAPFAVVEDPGQATSFARGESFPVTVSFAPTEPGQLSGVLSLPTTDGETVAFDLHGLATQPGIIATPGSLDFEDVPTGSASKQTITVVNTGTRPFHLTGVHGPSSPDFTLESSWDGDTYELGPQESEAVTVVFDPTAVGSADDRITVTGTLSAEEGGGEFTLVVPITATAIAGAAHMSLPATLDIGNVPVGLSGSAQFEIRNTGNVPLTITKAKAPAGVFSATDPIAEGLVIPAGESAWQTVTFTPTAPGRVSGEQYFYLLTGSDGQAAQLVMLSGTGVGDPITVKFEEMGGAAWGNSNPLGQAVGPRRQVLGGEFQEYVNGGIYWSPATGAHAVIGGIWKAYKANGGPVGLGFPLTDETATADGVGRYNHFSNQASIYWSKATGAHAIRGAIRDKWAQLGWERGLGYPTTDEKANADQVGRYSHFSRGGSIYWTKGTGAHAVAGAIRTRWAALGWERGLGYPTTDELATSDKVGRYNQFSRGGSIYWSPRTGAHAVTGVIRTKWAALGWERGLGYPTTEQVSVSGGHRQDFQRGRLTSNTRTGAVTVRK